MSEWHRPSCRRMPLRINLSSSSPSASGRRGQPRRTTEDGRLQLSSRLDESRLSTLDTRPALSFQSNTPRREPLRSSHFAPRISHCTLPCRPPEACRAGRPALPLAWSRAERSLQPCGLVFPPLAGRRLPTEPSSIDVPIRCGLRLPVPQLGHVSARHAQDGASTLMPPQRFDAQDVHEAWFKIAELIYTLWIEKLIFILSGISWHSGRLDPPTFFSGFA